MTHPEYGQKDVSFEYQNKFILNGWEIVKPLEDNAQEEKRKPGRPKK